MAIVDLAYYTTAYHGTEASDCDFPNYEARAEDVIGAMTHWKVTADTIATFPVMIQALVKKAICAQVDYFAVNGLDSVSSGNERGWTVGKVSVQGRYNNQTEKSGVMAAHVSPMVFLYLEQTGLLNPQVETIPQMPLLGGWY